MTFRTLIRRSLRFHWRSHLGVVLGAAIGSAALIGALVVGDSVRQTLFWQTMGRLDGTSVVLDSGDRFFGSDLLQRLIKLGTERAPITSTMSTNTFPAWGNGFTQVDSRIALRLPASATRQDGAARVNQVQLYGMDDAALANLHTGQVTFPGDTAAEWPRDQILINRALATQLGAKVGDELVIRVPKASALSADSAIAARDDTTVALRLRVAGIAGLASGRFANLNLRTTAQPPLNAFCNIADLGEAIGRENAANLILACPAFQGRKYNRWDYFKNAFRQSRFEKKPSPFLNFAWLTAKGGSVWTPVADQATQDILTGLLDQTFELTDADLRLAAHKRLPDTPNHLIGEPFIELKTPRIFLDKPVVASAAAVATNAQPILTYLATLVKAHTNAAPYSMVTAAGTPWTPAGLRDDEIVVSQWLAEDLHVTVGDEIALSYFLPESGAKLEEATNTFRIHSIVPMEMPWADRTLMPDFPGIEKAESTSEWDAGFPLTYEIRKKDDDYWKQHRGTPKAFITLAAGQKMWGNRFGNLTAIRFPIPANTTATNYQAELEAKVRASLKPEELGLRFEPVREQALKAASASQDFGGLFLGFSFFLIIAALLLMAMMFQFSLEQRAPEIGTLLALGFTPRLVRKILLREGVALAFIGGVIGAIGGICFAKAMLHGLSTVWRDAVGATALNFHVTGQTLVIGIFASVVVSTITIWLTLRKFVKRSPRELLVGEIQIDQSKAPNLKPKVIALAASVLALGLVGWMLAKGDTANAGAFFGAGALVLVAGLSFVSAWLVKLGGAPVSAPARHDGRLKHAGPEASAPFTMLALAVQSCARRRKRSLATVAMLACGSFLIASIGVFRLDANRDATQKTSGTGGFALIGETTLPVVQDLNAASGRDFFALNEQDLNGVKVVPFRVRPGDEASCLNLNRAQKPRLLGVKPELIYDRFAFVSRLNEMTKTSEWFDLQRGGLSLPIADDEIPAIGDANSIQWAMGKKVGDTIDYVDERGQPFKVRIAGAVANSILQGQLIIDEVEFVKRFPGESGYRMFLIDAPSNTLSQASATLSRAMQDVGLELTSTAVRLNQFNAVQNTYLGTFQVLGGLGLLLGSVGLGIVVLRNVLERRSELAVLLAVGFRKQQVQRLLLLENSALLVAGLAIGVVAAGIAVLPALLSPAAQLPVTSLAITLAAVLLNGALWTWAATRYAVRGDLLAALRNE